MKEEQKILQYYSLANAFCHGEKQLQSVRLMLTLTSDELVKEIIW